jgi:hypothetical protein
MEQLGQSATSCSIKIWAISGTKTSVLGSISVTSRPGNREHRVRGENDLPGAPGNVPRSHPSPILLTGAARTVSLQPCERITG